MSFQAHSQEQSFIEEHEHVWSPDDSRNSARQKCLDAIQKRCLERAGVLIITEMSKSQKETGKEIYSEAYASMQEFAMSTLQTVILSESVEVFKSSFITKIIARVTIDIDELKDALNRERRRIEELRKREMEIKLRQKEREIQWESEQRQVSERKESTTETVDKWYRHLEVSGSYSVVSYQWMLPENQKANTSTQLLRQELKVSYQTYKNSDFGIGFEFSFANIRNDAWSTNFAPSSTVSGFPQIDGLTVRSVDNFHERLYLPGIYFFANQNPTFLLGIRAGYAQTSFRVEHSTSSSNTSFVPIAISKDGGYGEVYLSLKLYLWALSFSLNAGFGSYLQGNYFGKQTSTSISSGSNYYIGIGTSLSLIFDIKKD
ncbi:MAG: hypothetical protein SNJ55_13150 [Chloroherpetonaceae bacterium]